MNRLTIYFTSDTHGYLVPTNLIDDTIRPMGLLAMRFPKDGNTLVIDGGDTIQGFSLTDTVSKIICPEETSEMVHL